MIALVGSSVSKRSAKIRLGQISENCNLAEMEAKIDYSKTEKK